MSKKFKSKNVEVEWAFDLNKTLRDNFSNKEWSDLSESIVNGVILRKIDKGLSPVNGVRMYAKYKDPKKYPGDRKPSNKPNLTLTGEMLSYYKSNPGSEPMSISLGLHSGTPDDVMTRAKANNQGTQKIKSETPSQENISKRSKKNSIRKQQKELKGIPARPFIPVKGQTYTRDIILEIRKLFAYCLNQAIKRGRK